MFYNIIKKLDKKFYFSTVSAHCDEPDKIYDPVTAQLSVLAIIQVVNLLSKYNQPTFFSANDHAQFILLVAQRKAHMAKVQKEISTIMECFIKHPGVEKISEIQPIIDSIMFTTSKQHIDKGVTIELLNKVNRFAEIFWQYKDVKTYTAVCPYPPKQIIVYPVLTQ